MILEIKDRDTVCRRGIASISMTNVESMASPMQSCPKRDGAGSVHVLCLFITPTPHGTEQFSHDAHPLHSP